MILMSDLNTRSTSGIASKLSIERKKCAVRFCFIYTIGLLRPSVIPSCYKVLEVKDNGGTLN